MRLFRPRVRTALVVALTAATFGAATVVAQQRGGRSRDVPYCYSPKECPRTPYDGRFTFVRVFFEARAGGGGRFGGEPGWHHDRPYAERNLSAIMREISYVNTFDGPTGGNVFAIGDPEIFRYPVLWVSEPGGWIPTDGEVASLREYLLKGGFMIFDDFGDWDNENLIRQMQRVLPELHPIRLTGEEPILKSFFDVELDRLAINQRGRGRGPDYWGLFEDNDITKRQLAVMNNNNDLGEYMEYSGTGFYAVDMSNDAYKLAVNYMMYALTH